MSARDDILRQVREARRATFGGGEAPSLPGLPPESPFAESLGADLVARFTAAATAAATRVVHARRVGLEECVTALYPGATQRLSCVAGVSGTVDLPAEPHALDSLDLLVCEGVIGVAENGAVWLPASRLGERAALVLARHVLVVLETSAIVADMHAGYAAVDVSAESFGVFLAGPSKTADIEQSLVIGAHGAMGTTVVLVGSAPRR